MEFDVKTIKNSPRTSDNIGVNNTLSHDEKSKYVQSFITQLFNKLNMNVINNNEINEERTESYDISIESAESKDKELPENNDLSEELDIIYVIDRFEGNYAVCENRETQEMKNINIYELPEGIKEGDVLRYKNRAYILDNDLKQAIEERIKEKTQNIFED